MSKKGTLFEIWLRDHRYRIAIDTYRDRAETKVLGIWVPFGIRSLDGSRARQIHQSWGRWSLDFWCWAIKLEDYGK